MHIISVSSQACDGHPLCSEGIQAPGQPRRMRTAPVPRCSLEGEIASDQLYRSVMWIRQMYIYKVFSTCQALFYFIYLYCWEYTRCYFNNYATSSSVLRRWWSECWVQRQKEGSSSSYISALCSSSFPSTFSSLQWWQFFVCLFFQIFRIILYCLFLFLFMHLTIVCMVTLHSVSDKPNIWNAWGGALNQLCVFCTGAKVAFSPVGLVIFTVGFFKIGCTVSLENLKILI